MYLDYDDLTADHISECEWCEKHNNDWEHCPEFKDLMGRLDVMADMEYERQREEQGPEPDENSSCNY